MYKFQTDQWRLGKILGSYFSNFGPFSSKKKVVDVSGPLANSVNSLMIRRRISCLDPQREVGRNGLPFIVHHTFRGQGGMILGPYAVPLARHALAVAQCRRDQISELIRTALAVYQLAAKTNPTPSQGPYAALHRAVHEDFAAMRTYTAASSIAGPLMKKGWSIEAAWKIYDEYCPRRASGVPRFGRQQPLRVRH